MPPTVLLEGRSLTKRFGKRVVVDDVSVHVTAGEVVGLLGPNGAGKTTTFGMMTGQLQPDGGSVRLGDADITHLPMHARAKLGIGYLPQEASIFRKLTVRENLLAILELQPLSRADRNRRADELVHEFGLQAVSSSKGETLSGGERRRAEIARCLVTQPTFILLDEPFAGVDPIHVQELQKEIARIRSRGIGILITDHNVRDTLRICDRAYILAEGHMLESGTPAEIASSPRAKATYLGADFTLS